MGLALRLEKESLDSISSHKDSYMKKVFDFNQFKGCKSYVDFINKEKFFTFTLVVLEGDYAFGNECEFKDTKEFEAFCTKNEMLIQKVKKYPNVSLKKRYMHLDEEELEVFELLKTRYYQILDKKYILDPGIFESDNNDDSQKIQHDSETLFDKMYLVLGAFYDAYADLDADFLTPVVKKILKKAYMIAEKHNYLKNSSTESLIKINSRSYKRAIDELSK